MHEDIPNKCSVFLRSSSFSGCYFISPLFFLFLHTPPSPLLLSPLPLLSGWLNYIVRTRHYLQCNQFCLRAANVLIPIHTNKTKRGHLLPAIICLCIGMGVQVTSNYRNSFRRFPVLNARRCGHGTRFLPPDRIISRKDFHSNFRVFFFFFRSRYERNE